MQPRLVNQYYYFLLNVSDTVDKVHWCILPIGVLFPIAWNIFDQVALINASNIHNNAVVVVHLVNRDFESSDATALFSYNNAVLPADSLELCDWADGIHCGVMLFQCF